MALKKNKGNRRMMMDVLIRRKERKKQIKFLIELQSQLLNEKHELHNREMHISGKFLSVQADLINDPINDPIKLEGREKQIFDILHENPSLTRVEMAKRIGCSDSTVKRTLQKLMDKGAIKRIGSNKKGEWIIVYKKQQIESLTKGNTQ